MTTGSYVVVYKTPVRAVSLCVCVCVSVETFLTPLMVLVHSESFTGRLFNIQPDSSLTQINTHQRLQLYSSFYKLQKLATHRFIVQTSASLSERATVRVCVCVRARSDTHLELRPVHAHSGAVGVPPPSQVFAVIGCLDRLALISVQARKPAEQQRPAISASSPLFLWQQRAKKKEETFDRRRTGGGSEDEGLKTLHVFMAARETEAN